MYGGARAEKERIRQEIRTVNEGLTDEYRREASAEITRRVLELPAWKQAKTVMAYSSMTQEPDTRELMDTALREGKTLLVPRMTDRTGSMVALQVTDPDAMEPGTLGIAEPVMPDKPVRTPEPDLILVPCMAASPGGIRLGHGAGYYDRFLEGISGTTVCLCFRTQLRPDLPAEPTDIPMDYVITDGGD